MRPRTRRLIVALATLATVLGMYGVVRSVDHGRSRSLGTRPPDVAAVPGRPLEIRSPIAKNQTPAFPEQTRAVSVITRTPLDVEVVAQGMHVPWSMAFLPDGAVLVTEKPGTMRIVTRDGRIGEPIAGVPTVVYRRDAGLLDVVVDPAFASNRRIYFTYVEPRGSGNGVAIARARLSDDRSRLDDLRVILRVEPDLDNPEHYGSRLLFDPEGRLYVSLAERMAEDVRLQAQRLDSRLGKILRITTDGAPAAGNPFEHTPGALPEIWSYGHRDPQGLTWRPGTRELWETEHGPQAGDEVNLIKPGANYGWPMIAYGTEYDGRPVNGGRTSMEGMEQPVYYWDPAIAPSGAVFYDGSLVPEWKDNLFVAALAGQHLARLVIDGHHVVGEERLLLEQHQRIRTVREGPDGALWVVTDNKNGRLIRIGPAGQPWPRQTGAASGPADRGK